MARPVARHLIRAASVWIVEHVGTRTSRMYHTENTNLYKLVNACIDHGPGWAHPGSRKQGRKLSSLTGPKLWDIVGLRKMKRALMRSSMRAAQGPWLRDENIAPGIARHWRPRPRVTNPSSKYQASSIKRQASSFRTNLFKRQATSIPS
jgi:hypothetical protein